MSIWVSQRVVDQDGHEREARAVEYRHTDQMSITGPTPIRIDVAAGGLDRSVRLCAWYMDPLEPYAELMLPIESAVTLRDLLTAAIRWSEHGEDATDGH